VQAIQQARDPPTVASGLPSATSPTLAETSSYATGRPIQLNFPQIISY